MKKFILPTITPTILLILAGPVYASSLEPTRDYATALAQPVAPALLGVQATPLVSPPPSLQTPAQKKAAQNKRRIAARRAYVHRIRTAPVDWRWGSILNLYTGGSYATGHVNSLWQNAPRSSIVLQAAVRYRVPYRLLLGVWGAESTWGQAWNHFGLIGPATGNLRHDAFYAAKLFDRFYRQRYGRPAVS